ncbi:MAG: SDR family oxidoreductase [Bryobacterales bacterium]|nr:SDR family oxidoreductase [Bryobacterales bacterium]
MSMFRGKIAFVTGGGAGLGRALCEKLASCGAVTVVTDINEGSATQVAASISAAGGHASALKLDVADQESVTAAVNSVVARFGRLDYMFNNAGIMALSEFRDMSPELWNRMIGVNLLGVVHGTAAAYAHMVRQGYGHIVNIASLAGLVHLPTATAYSMTKHAVVGLTTSLRPEASRLGVKVSVVCPGLIATGGELIVIQAKLNPDQDSTSAKKFLTPAVAAQLVLKGVERNQAVIVFPFTSRLLWWLHRLHAPLLMPLHSRVVDAFASVRLPDNETHAESAR